METNTNTNTDIKKPAGAWGKTHPGACQFPAQGGSCERDTACPMYTELR